MSEMDTEDTNLVKTWIALHHAEAKSQAYTDNFWAFTTLSDMCESSPERCWKLIQEIRKSDGSDIILANLASGPLEELLVQHGQKFIDAVEKLAGDDEQFRKLLGAVWQNDIAEDVWVRIKRVAGPSF
jgi:hypothetical protein